MSAEKLIRAIARVVIDEAKSNPEFAKKVVAAASGAMADMPATARRKKPEPPFNPVNVIRNDGPRVLRTRLGDLTARELRAMITAYGLDKRETPKASAAKKDLVAFVVKQAGATLNKEKLF